MKYIKLRNVRLKGFRSFTDEQVVSIPESGLIGIRGDSGAGKTNLHLAIAYALGYSPLSQADLQSWEWLTDNKLRVELEFDTHLGPVTLVRGESAYIQIGDTITNASAKAIGQELQKLVEVPLDLIEALTFRPQGEPARFVSMTDSEKKEFLSKVLNLEIIEKEIEEWVKKNNKTKEEVDKLTTVINTLNGQLVEPAAFELQHTGHLELLIASIGTLVKEAEKEKLKVESSIKETEKNFVPDLTAMSEVESKLQQAIEELAAEEKILKTQKDECSSLITELKKKTGSLEAVVARLPTIKNNVASKTRELNGILKSICPTCDQTWINQDDRKEKLEAELNELAEQYCAIEPVQIELKTIKELIEKHTADLLAMANPKIGILTKHVGSLKILKNDESNKIKQQKDSALKDLYIEYSKAKDKWNSISAELSDRKNELKLIKQRNDSYAFNNDTSRKAYELLVNKIEKQSAELNSLVKVYEVQGDYVDLLKAFLGSIFEDVLHEISTETNEFLKNLPNVDTKTIQFVTERTTNKGTTRQEIRPVVMINNRPCTLKSLSGGQSNSVGLAIDLAVGSVITKRTGLNLGWQVFDESFDGMDLKTKESCLELLKKAAQDKVIFTIDHFSEINEMYEKILYVETNNGISSIKENP